MPDASELDTVVAIDVDVKDGDFVVIDGAGKIVELEDRKTKEMRRKLQLPLKCPSGRVKTLLLNETSRRDIIKVYGPNTETWVGKQAIVAILTKDVFGDIKRLIYLQPVR